MGIGKWQPVRCHFLTGPDPQVCMQTRYIRRRRFSKENRLVQGAGALALNACQAAGNKPGGT